MDLQELDRELIDAFIDEGLRAYAAIYSPPTGGTTTAGNRRCYVNTTRQTFGDAGNLTAPRIVVGLLLADGAVEQRGTLLVGAVTYRLQKLDETDQADESLEWWVVTRV